jgi:hypothetical protein
MFRIWFLYPHFHSAKEQWQFSKTAASVSLVLFFTAFVMHAFSFSTCQGIWNR